MRRLQGLVVIVGAVLLSGRALGAVEPSAAQRPVDFNRDIRPILSDNCFTCHGPDEGQRQADLRFDTREGLLGKGGELRVVVPGDPAKSRLYQRVSAEDESVRMPPAWSGKTLTAKQIELIRDWIQQGAPWATHWAFVPPVRPALPRVKNQAWVRNEIDRFVLARLERESLEPSPLAEKTALIRRATLDLTGLPPTPQEIDAFLADRSPQAYEKVVDRLLASPRYGEHMAVDWLNGARYADTNGYQTDGERYMWRWRDWVIEAFNRNMPFDEFTIEQLAGDLLPNPTLDQVIATGFNRNHRGNGEGGIISEEYAVEYVADRVETTSTVWMGLTVGCARCHDHKYDPIRQKEFYQVFAYFNSIPERGLANKNGNSPPLIKAPTAKQEAELARMERELAAAEKGFSALEPELGAAQQVWEKSLNPSEPIDWTPSDDVVVALPFENDISSAVPLHKDDKAITPGVKEGTMQFVAGRVGQAGSFDGTRYVEVGDVAKFDETDKFSLAAWLYPVAPEGTILSRSKDSPEGMQGYGLSLKDGKLQVALVARWLDVSVRLETKELLELNRWHHIVMTYDGSRVASGVRVYIDGKRQELNVLLDQLTQSFANTEPLRIGGWGGPGNRFHGALDEVRIYRRVLTPRESAALATAKTVNQIVSVSPQMRSLGEAEKVRGYFLAKAAPAHVRRAWENLVGLRHGREAFVDSLPTVMVMQDLETPHQAYVLKRGVYDQPGEKVERGVPAVLPPFPKDAPNNRLGFARWLVSPSHPLTARVTVNRFWQKFFGTGLVKTVEDFGAQGEPPSHPELLDWLATEFIRIGWDMKRLHKLILTSATYRQSSKATPLLLEKDPENRLLARGPRVRLPAETIRDQALAISGLLVEKIGGPSVKPYQPAGLWAELTGGEDYRPDTGENLYRRSLYTFWKRTAPPPAMAIFDAPARETCVVRATRTSSPLQALNLMNDVTYLEASRVLAQHMIEQGGRTPAERLIYAFRRATARRPSPKERDILLGSLEHYRSIYREDPAAAKKFVNVGESPRDPKLDTKELAAYTAVASLILNLDETISKQ